MIFKCFYYYYFEKPPLFPINKHAASALPSATKKKKKRRELPSLVMFHTPPHMQTVTQHGADRFVESKHC